MDELLAENEILRETKKAEVDIVKRSYKVKIAEARRFDTEVKKVVSLKYGPDESMLSPLIALF